MVRMADANYRQLKAHSQLPNACQYNALLYLKPFGYKFNVKLWPANLTVRLWSQGVENGTTNRNVDPSFPFNFYTHYGPILVHHLATIHNVADDG